MRALRLMGKIIYLWYWLIPTRLGVLAFIGYFLLIYILFGSIDIDEIKIVLGKNDNLYFFLFWLPFAIPMLLSLGAVFGSSPGSKSKSLEDAIKFRNGQMSIGSDIEASEILRNTYYLDMLRKNDSDVFIQARRGFDAKYAVKPPTEVFNDLMDNKNT